VHGQGPVDIIVERGWFTNLDHEWEEPILAGIYRRLGAIGRVIRMDRRGSGLSDRLDRDVLPTIEARSDDILAVMGAAGSERAALLGIGHGAAVFTVFAATHPDRTVALLFWAPVSSHVSRYGEETLAEWGDDARGRWATREYAEAFVKSGAPSRSDDDGLIRWFQEEQRLSATPDEAAILLRLAWQTNIEDVLPTVHVPTLVCWREGLDEQTKAVGRRIVDAVPGAVGSELPGDDLFMIAGDWKRAVTEIEDFVVSAAETAPDADRVLATVMFTDVVGSTEHAVEIGDREWRHLVDRHHAAVRHELTRFRGREVDTAGDGFFAAFDGPARAIRCASAIRSAVDQLGLRLRIGVHAGECERVGSGLRGVAVHIGARVGASAAPGEILVSSTVRDLVAGSGIQFEDAGRHALKGVPDDWRLYRVASVGK
jgi:class 3 adenylate cyclase